jgi:hypothetical protein
MPAVVREIAIVSGAVVIIGMAPIALFYAWLTGVIAVYEMALLASLAVGAAAMAASGWAIRRIVRAPTLGTASQ